MFSQIIGSIFEINDTSFIVLQFRKNALIKQKKTNTKIGNLIISQWHESVNEFENQGVTLNVTSLLIIEIIYKNIDLIYLNVTRKSYNYDYPSCYTESHLSIMKEINKFSILWYFMTTNYFIYMLNLLTRKCSRELAFTASSSPNSYGVYCYLHFILFWITGIIVISSGFQFLPD